MNYVLDTNILLLYLKDDRTKAIIEQHYDPFAAVNNPIISIVTVGEMRALARKNHWGDKRLKAVETLMRKGVTVVVKDPSAKVTATRVFADLMSISNYLYQDY